jgi:hypothetical protein
MLSACAAIAAGVQRVAALPAGIIGTRQGVDILPDVAMRKLGARSARDERQLFLNISDDVVFGSRYRDPHHQATFATVAHLNLALQIGRKGRQHGPQQSERRIDAQRRPVDFADCMMSFARPAMKSLPLASEPQLKGPHRQCRAGYEQRAPSLEHSSHKTWLSSLSNRETTFQQARGRRRHGQ